MAECAAGCAPTCTVNPVGRPTLCDYLGPGCFSEWFFVAIWVWFLIFVWLVIAVITFLFAMLGLLVGFLSGLVSLVQVLFIPLLLAFLLWFFYPQLAAPIRQVVYPLINTMIELTVVAWNLLLILW